MKIVYSLNSLFIEYKNDPLNENNLFVKYIINALNFVTFDQPNTSAVIHCYP